MQAFHITQLRSFLPRSAVTAPNVSAWHVGMHLHHCALSICGICKQLIASDSPMPRAGFSPVRSLMLITGWIPRGRAQSPEAVIPKYDIGTDEIVTLLDQGQALLSTASSLDRGRWFIHPMLGPMTRKQTLRFIAVHNHHHLKIMREIVNAVNV